MRTVPVDFLGYQIPEHEGMRDPRVEQNHGFDRFGEVDGFIFGPSNMKLVGGEPENGPSAGRNLEDGRFAQAAIRDLVSVGNAQIVQEIDQFPALLGPGLIKHVRIEERVEEELIFVTLLNDCATPRFIIHVF